MRRTTRKDELVFEDIQHQHACGTVR